jgi:hypothetical protein
LSVADYVADAPKYRALFDPAWTIVQLRDSDVTTDAWQKGKTHFSREAPGEPLHVAVVDRQGYGTVKQAQLVRFIDSAGNAAALVNWTLRRVSLFAEGIQQEPPLFRAGSVEKVLKGDEQDETKVFPIEEELALLAEAYRSKLTILYIANFDPRQPQTPSETETLVMGAAEKLDLRVANTRAAYAYLALKHVAPFGFANTVYNYGHWNGYGHGAAAAQLSAELLKLHRDGLL